MIPVLYDSIANYKGLGVGKLAETISCVVHEEINGDYSLELTYPVTGEYYTDLMAGGLIEVVVPSVGGNLSSELFDLYKSSLPIDGVVTFYANHVSRRLARSINIGAVSSSGWRVYVGTNIKTAWENSAPADWDGLTMYKATLTGATNKKPDSRYINISAPKNALSLLIGENESAVKNFGGEFAFKMHGGGAKQLDIYWLDKRGSDKDSSAIFGWNLTDINRTIDKTGIFNAYIPYWTDGTDYVFGDVTQGSTPVSPVIAAPFDCSFLFSTKPTKAELEAFATRSLDANNTMSGEQSISLDMLNASQIDPNAKIELGDTIHAYWGKAGVNVDMRITSYDYDVISEQYSTLNLGTQQQEFVSTGSPSTAGSAANYQDAYVNGRLNVSGEMNVAGGVAFGGVVDIKNRRCTSSIPASSVGWKRILTYSAINANMATGSNPFTVDITIFEQARQIHSIRLNGTTTNIFFDNEQSVLQASSYNVIDGIRYTYDGNNQGHIDVHYARSFARVCTAYFDVKCRHLPWRGSFVPVDFTAVADNPSGETIYATYNFAENGFVFNAPVLFGDAVSGQGFADLLFGLGNKIVSNTDCDSIQTEGKYTCPSLSVGGTLLNAPYSSAFGMLVLRVSGVERFVQIAIPNSTTITIKIRYFDGSSWTEWKTITPT